MTVTTKFAKCNNIKCGFIFPIEEQYLFTNNWILCPSCSNYIKERHVIVCKNCQSVVDFLDPQEEEYPTVFEVKKCTYCTGNEKDESSFLPITYVERQI